MTTEELSSMVNTTERTLLQLRRDGGGPPYVRVGAQPRCAPELLRAIGGDRFPPRLSVVPR
jgi:hypothetical protein